MHNFLMLPVSVIPEWTKQNVPTYNLGRFSNDGQFMLIDDAHPLSTYQKWLGPNINMLDSILAAAIRVTAAEFKNIEESQPDLWGGIDE